MFSRKYVFETKRTRLRRVLRSITLALLGLATLVIVVANIIPFYGHRANQSFKEAFFKRAPDAIMVFTGDAGRIRKALELLKKYPGAKFLVSGVQARNTMERIIRSMDTSEVALPRPIQIDLDYLSQNTIGNVISTLGYLKENQDIERPVIVSHDYHILRIHLLLKAIERKDTVIWYHALDSNPFNWRSQKIYILEVLKIFRTLLLSSALSDETIEIE